MQTAVYSNSYILNFTQCYANGRLKYSELSNLLQLTAAEHAEQLGFGYWEMVKNKQAWVLSRVRIEIQQLPRFLDEINIYTWIQDFSGNRSIRNFEVFQNDRKIIGASSFWAVFNTKERKSENLALEINPNLITPEKSATQKPFRKLEIPSDFQLTNSYTPKLSDLDIVNHVNNVKYMDWCVDHLAPTLVLKEQLKTIDINYLKELKLGEEVEIRQRQKENEIDFSIVRGGRTIFLMHATK